MTPELEIKIAELEKQIDRLKLVVNALHNPSEIDPQIIKTFQDRTPTALQSDSKAASSENQAVDEGATNTYNVLKPPDGFDKATIDGVVHYYPYYL